jgi:hypothetical protein
VLLFVSPAAVSPTSRGLFRRSNSSSVPCATVRRASLPFSNGEVFVAKPNYAFAKRQRELAKKQKKEAKQKEREAAKAPADDSATPDTSGTPTIPTPDSPGG